MAPIVPHGIPTHHLGFERRNSNCRGRPSTAVATKPKQHTRCSSLGLKSGQRTFVRREFRGARRPDGGRESPAGLSATGMSPISLQGRTCGVSRRALPPAGRPLRLRRKILAARPGIVFSRAALLQQVWSGDTYVTERTVDTVISRLRRKIEREPQDPELLLTAWGVG